MKILKTVIFCLAVAAPVALGAFQYGRMVQSATLKEDVHGEEYRHGEMKREGHGNGGDAHETAHDGHGRETDAHGAGEPHKGHVQEDRVTLNEEQMKTLGVVVSKAGPGSLGRVMALPGEINLNEDAQALVTPYVSGHVKEIRKRQGDMVKEGEVMAVLESRELADAGALYLAARAHLVLADKTFEREKSLWQKKISPETDYLEAKTALSAARIEVRSARQKLMALGLKKSTINKLPGRSDNSLTRYEILSPLNGQVLRKNLTLGEMVETTTPVYRVADMSTVWVEIDVLQNQLPHLKKGMTVGIRTDNPLRKAQGVLTYIGPLVGKQTRTANGRALLANPKGFWRPGLFVTVEIEAARKEVPVVISKNAVQDVGAKSVVFVPEMNGFEAKIVTTGASDENHVEITSGLFPGEAYVSEGAFELKAALITDTLGSHAGHGH